MLRLGRRTARAVAHHGQKRGYIVPTPLVEDLEKRGFIHTITRSISRLGFMIFL